MKTKLKVFKTNWTISKTPLNKMGSRPITAGQRNDLRALIQLGANRLQLVQMAKK
jgi:hypothetical protein